MAHRKVVTSFGSALVLGGALLGGALLGPGALLWGCTDWGCSTWGYGCTTSDNLASSQHKLWLYYSGYNSPDM